MSAYVKILRKLLSLHRDTVVRTVEDGNKDTHNQLSQISTAIHDQSNSLQSVDLRLNAHAQGTHRQLSLVQATQDDHVNLTRSVVARLQDQSLQALQMETKIAETIQQGTSRMEDKLDTVLMALQLLHPSHQLQAFQRHGSIEEHTQDRIHPAQSRSCQLLPGSPIRTRLGPPDGHCQRVPTSPEQSIVATFPLNEFTCQCKRLAWRDRKNIPWNKVFFWYTTTTHHPMCPLHIPTQRSTTVAARFILSGYKKGYHIEAALKWGGDFMSPHVIYRNIVSDSAPAFTLVEMLSWFLGQAKDADNISNGLSLTLRTLIALFRDKRAGPRDTDPGGKNLFHVSLPLPVYVAFAEYVSSRFFWVRLLQCCTCAMPFL